MQAGSYNFVDQPIVRISYQAIMLLSQFFYMTSISLDEMNNNIFARSSDRHFDPTKFEYFELRCQDAREYSKVRI